MSTYEIFDGHNRAPDYPTFESALADSPAGRAVLIAQIATDGAYRIQWHKTGKGKVNVISHHGWPADHVTGEWSTGPMPDQDEPSSHATEDCGCGEWEDGDIDDRCGELLEQRVDFRQAILHDDAAHGPSFVRWLTQSEIDAFHLAGIAYEVQP